MPLTVATRLGPFEVLGPLGVGGMGEVYRARDTRLGRDVAVKVLPSAYSADPTSNKMMAAAVKVSGGRFEAGAVQPLFDIHPVTSPLAAYDVSRDGRFLVNTVEQQSAINPITIVINWPATLRK